MPAYAQTRQEKRLMLAAGKKRCPVCKEVKTVDLFYKATSAADGLDSRCKECRKTYERTDARKNVVHKYMAQKDVRERMIELKRTYRKKDTYRERIRLYQQSEQAKRKQAERRKTIQATARRKVNNAAQAGRLPHISTQKCVICGKQAQQYHHHNGYDKEHWLDVIPVCIPCHEHLHSD